MSTSLTTCEWKKVFYEKMEVAKPADSWELIIDPNLKPNELGPGWKQYLEQHASGRASKMQGSDGDITIRSRGTRGLSTKSSVDSITLHLTDKKRITENGSNTRFGGSTVLGAGTPGSLPMWSSSSTCTWTVPSVLAQCACVCSSSCATSAAPHGWTSPACWRRTSRAWWTTSSPVCASSATTRMGASIASTWPAGPTPDCTAASSARLARKASCTGSPARSCWRRTPPSPMTPRGRAKLVLSPTSSHFAGAFSGVPSAWSLSTCSSSEAARDSFNGVG
ncbi:receptor transporter protein 2 (predicted), isoform CRA_a, partial [Rattus norvegicus]